jgi:hypothetical protein
MNEIFIKNIDDIIEAKYGKKDKYMDVTNILINLIKSNCLKLEISNKLFGSDPYENILKELIINTSNNNYIINEESILKINLDSNLNNELNINTQNKFKINYYIILSNKEQENMIDFYFIFMKHIIEQCGHNYIKVYLNKVKSEIVKTKNNVVILYKSIFEKKDIFFIKNNSIKVYFLNVEQLSLLLDNTDDDCKLKKNMQNYFFKSIKFITENDLSIIDYSYENKYIWSENYDIKNIIVLEPCLTDNMINKREKGIELISLFNHIEYRHNYKHKYLLDLEIKSFSGYFCNKRRNLFTESKILINIHAGNSYKICELFRIYEAIAHKMIIISQNCYNHNLISLKEYIYFCKDEDMKTKINKIQGNYNNIYNNLYNKSVDDIFKNIKLKYLSFFSNYIEHYI